MSALFLIAGLAVVAWLCHDYLAAGQREAFERACEDALEVCGESNVIDLDSRRHAS